MTMLPIKPSLVTSALAKVLAWLAHGCKIEPYDDSNFGVLVFDFSLF